MKSFKKYALIGILLLFSGILAKGQDPVFSQFYNASMYLNPALAGLEREVMAGINYRSQWQSIGVPFTTFQITYVHPIIKRGVRPIHLGGVGVSLLNDRTGENGEFNQLGALFTGAYNLHLNSYGTSFITFGLQGGVVQKTVNPGALQWSSQYDPLTGFDNSAGPGIWSESARTYYPLFNLGISWSMRRGKNYSGRKVSVYQGLAISNLNRPDVSVFDDGADPIPITLKVHGGAEFAISAKASFAPHYLVQHQASEFQVNLGAFFAYYLTDPKTPMATMVLAGGWYRLNDAFILSAGMEIKAVRVIFSFDRNVHSLSRYFGNASAYELSLQWRLKKGNQLRRFGTPMI